MSRVIVNIHGTGRTSSDFWVPRVAAVSAQLGWEPPHLPVWWGDLIDVGATASALGREASEWLNRAWPDVRMLPGLTLRSATRTVEWFFDLCHRVADAAAGVVAYFTSNRLRESIRDRLRSALELVSRHGHEVVLVSESLGCLVAFDVLREEAHRYRVHTWFTLGCALGTLVRTGQRTRDLGAINRQTVKHWHNLYAAKDPIAQPIADIFPEYPIRDEPVATGDGPLSAHHYWGCPRVPALIAQALQV